MSCCENCQHHDYCDYSAKDSKAMTYCSSKYDDTPAKDRRSKGDLHEMA